MLPSLTVKSLLESLSLAAIQSHECIASALGGDLTRYALSSESDQPSYAQAMASHESEAWKKAMDTEFELLELHQTGELVPRPPNAQVLGGRWVLLKKWDENGEVEHLKA